MKRMITRALVLSSLLLLAAATGFAQDAALAVTAKAAVVDGVVKPGEYAWTKDLGQMQLSISRSGDTLFVGVVGETAGWVSVGLGSRRMDGADIFFGFVEPSGKVQFKPQVGAGHGHSDTAEKAILDSVISSAMKEEGGKTTLEFALKSAQWIRKGQAALDLIYAIGAQDSFSPRHTMRGSLSVALAQ
jgi:hypothetical protein